ncbi:MAG: hypothetical protein KatS3mg105_2148 [Gemmatales bacterium]|nr:MAG: hypothetical protein KatS3mg105_2148 [Gemmatales bacterium]
MTRHYVCLFGFLISALASVVRADEKQLGKSEHDPEVERRSFKLLDGFEVNLFAAEPLLVNPIHMTWDPYGRLWVCCSTSYPQLKPGQKPNDQIIVLEDTDGDGKADRSTIFADGLYVPTGLELGDGGVYVANPPDLLFLKDTNGDLKADIRKVVLTGFGTEDNHHCISAWRWGPGGWLYFQEGTFLHSQIETPYGPVRLENGGVFQFRPRELRLRVFADYRASNPWGHMFDRWGQSIIIDNPNLYFAAPLTANSRAKLAYEPSGKGTKQCGGDFVSGRHLPAEFHGQIWTNQYKANVVARYQVRDDGAGVVITGLEPLIRSTSQNFRPVDLKVGPDGAVYILDWYNPLIGHMQHSFRDPRRDTSHGRVWRVTCKGRPLVKKPNLVGVPLAELLDHLKDPEDWTRYQVKRVLYDSDPKQAAAALTKWLATLDSKDANFEHHRLEALWCFQTIGVVHDDLLRQVLRSKDFRARAAGFRVMRYWHEQINDPLQLLAEGVADEHPRVRLEAVLTCGFVPKPEAVVIAVRALNKPTDRYLDHALKLTVDGLQEHWLPAHRAGKLRFDNDKHRNFALSNLVSSESVGVLIDLLNSGDLDANKLEGPAAAVAQQATAQQLEPLVLSLIEHTREYKTRGKNAGDPALIARILEAMNEAARMRGVRPKNMEKMIARCFDVPHIATQEAAVRLIGACKLHSQSKRLQQLVARTKNDSLRLAAAQSLGELGGKPNLAYLEKLLDPKQPISRRYAGAIGLAAADLKASAKKVADVLAADPKDADPVPLVSLFLAKKGGADLLAAALEHSKPHEKTSARVMQYLIEIGEQHPGIVKAFGGTITPQSLEAQLLKEDVFKLAAEVRKKGDPKRGEQIFRRHDLACMSCHGIGNAGPLIGPDLAAIGSSSPPDYIVDSLLRPSKVIKEFFESVVIITTDGRVINGILRLKDKDKVVIRDPTKQGKEVTIPMSQIEEVAEGPSLMPQGLANKLRNRQEFLDLARFLTELGRPGPYATSVAQVVRWWRLTEMETLPEELESELFDHASKKTKSVYSMVDGLLPASDLAGTKRYVLASALVDVAHAGPVQLDINSPSDVAIYLDGQRIHLAADSILKLPVGRHTLTFAIDRTKRGKTGLRVELKEVKGASTVFQVIGRL